MSATPQAIETLLGGQVRVQRRRYDHFNRSDIVGMPTTDMELTIDPQHDYAESLSAVIGPGEARRIAAALGAVADEIEDEQPAATELLTEAQLAEIQERWDLAFVNQRNMARLYEVVNDIPALLRHARAMMQASQ